MAVRIPGPQPTAGLEPFFLNPSTDRFRSPNGSAAGQYQPATDAAAEIVNRDLAPDGGSVNNTGDLEAEQANQADAIQAHADRAAIDVAGATTLLVEQVSPQLGAVDDAANTAAVATGASQPANNPATIPPPPDIPNPDAGKGPDTRV